MNRRSPGNRRQTPTWTSKENERKIQPWISNERRNGVFSTFHHRGPISSISIQLLPGREREKEHSEYKRCLFLSSLQLLNENPFSLSLQLIVEKEMSSLSLSLSFSHVRLNYSKTEFILLLVEKWFSTTACSRFKQRTILLWCPKKDRCQLSKRKHRHRRRRRILGFIRKI